MTSAFRVFMLFLSREWVFHAAVASHITQIFGMSGHMSRAINCAKLLSLNAMQPSQTRVSLAAKEGVSEQFPCFTWTALLDLAALRIGQDQYAKHGMITFNSEWCALPVGAFLVTRKLILQSKVEMRKT